MVKRKSFSSSKFIALGYIIVILVGTFLLALPVSSKDNTWTSFINSLFTATTSTCVTGLVAYDTYTHWSIFGQIVILLLIQVGGIGFMTVISLMGMFLKRKINIHEQKVIMQASGTIKISDTLVLIKKIVIVTLIVELIGACILSIRFIPMLGIGTGIYYSIFHSISAFCNAGIDLMGRFAEFTSFSTLYNDYLVNIVIMILITSGGLGFLVWSDLFECKFNVKKLHLHTRIVLISSLILIIVPTICFYLFEKDNLLVNMNEGEKILCSLFQSVTCRTAGFNTIDMSKLSDSSILLSIVLMLIGGSPGSTAGGIKTTTFVVLLFSIAYSFKNTTNITVGKKQLDKSILKQACAIIMLYISSVVFASIIILSIEPSLQLRDVLFETVSAIGTVGLTTGITQELTIISKILIIILMYIGRIGALSVIMLFESSTEEEIKQRPIEKILIG